MHAINSAQVITSLSSVLKELVENALDAGSPAVEVKCKNYGLDQVQVLDAGRGIDKEDFEAIGAILSTSVRERDLLLVRS